MTEPTVPEGSEQDGAGVPDGFARLWMPHRMAYIKGENKPVGSQEGDGCPFCRIPSLGDEDGLIVARGQLVYSVLNLYPYNAGHLMVLPYRHVADYTDLDEAETAELAAFTKRADDRAAHRVRRPGLQYRHEHGVGGGCGHRGAPAPARGAPVGRGHQLHAGGRPHPRPAPAAQGHPQADRRRLG